MDEWLPVVLGCLWGVVAATSWRRPSPPARRLLFVAGLLAIGTFATIASGEAARSPWFAAVDVALAALGALAGAALRRTAPTAARTLLPRRATRRSV
jgi:hypothetical protein